jgi:hypothetical protein
MKARKHVKECTMREGKEAREESTRAEEDRKPRNNKDLCILHEVATAAQMDKNTVQSVNWGPQRELQEDQGGAITARYSQENMTSCWQERSMFCRQQTVGVSNVQAPRSSKHATCANVTDDGQLLHTV